MNCENHNPYQALTRIFHEPNRLAIMSALAAASEELRFTELKDQCDLTDGNLSRHLKTLEESEMIQIRKCFIDQKPRTTITITNSGRSSFLDYLGNLEEVLNKAANALAADKQKSATALNMQSV